MLPLRKLAELVVGRPWHVIALLAVVTAILGHQASQLEADLDLEKNYPPAHPYVQIHNAIRDQFGGDRFVVIAVVPKTGDVWNRHTLEIVRSLTVDALQLPQVIATNVVSLASPNVRTIEEAPDGGIAVHYLMREVPDDAAGIAALRARYETSPMLRASLVSPDGRAALVLVDFWKQASPETIHRELTALLDRHRDPRVDLYMAGEPLFRHEGLSQIASARKVFAVAYFAVAGILWLSFRSLQGMFIPMLTATCAVIWALGFMRLGGMGIDVWNNSVPILVVAVGASHSAQMLKRYYEELERLGDNRLAVVESMARIGPVMIAAGVTAASGFASLGLFGIPAIRNFGLGCAWGILSAVVLEMTFVPALRSVLRPRRLAHPIRTAAGNTALDLIARLIQARGGWPLVIAGVVATLGALAGAPRIVIGSASRDYLPVGSITKDHLDRIEEHTKGIVTMGILFEGEPGMAKNPRVLRTMAGLQQALEQDPAVARTASVADLVREANRTLVANGDRSGYRLPEDPDTVAQLMFLSSSPAYDRFVDRSYRRAVVWAYLATDDTPVMGRILRLAHEYVARHDLDGLATVRVAGGGGPAIFAMNEHTTRGKVANTAVILGAIFAVASLVLWSAQAGLYVITPIGLTVLCLFGTLGWTGIRLDMATSSVIAIGAGIGADYAIYFLYRLREEYTATREMNAALHRTLHTSGRAVIFVASAIAGGFLCLGLSPYPALRSGATLIPLTMAMSCLGAITVMPSLVILTRPRFIFGRPV